ncbi:MAG TPA: hypothetical protein VGF53_14865 [Pseudolabrys sp.]
MKSATSGAIIAPSSWATLAVTIRNFLRLLDRSSDRLGLVAASLACAAVTAATTGSLADEGGVGFWVPGFFGSLAATPQQPGFAFAMIYYHTSVSGGGDVAFARQVTRGNITANFNGNLTARRELRLRHDRAMPRHGQRKGWVLRTQASRSAKFVADGKGRGT